MSTHANNPTPLDIGKAEYVDNPVIGTIDTKKADDLAVGYNLNFEPYASKYDNKLVVDREANGDVIGMVPSPRRNSNLSEKGKDKDHMDLKFEFHGPKRTSDERHYFKTIQEGYLEKVRGKRNSLDEVLDDNNNQ